MTTPPVTITRRTIFVTQLRPHRDNYRSHPPSQIAKLRQSVKRFGQFRSIVCVPDASHPGDYTIVAGHGCVEAMAAEGLVAVECDVLPPDVSRETISAIMLADNLSSNGAEDDSEILATLLQQQQDAGFDLASVGSDEESLRQLLENLGEEYVGNEQEEGDGGDEFEVHPNEVEIRCNRGDLWQLGDHRLLVDDCTKIENVQRVNQGESIDMIFTDPPYNCADEMSESFYAHTDSPAMRNLSISPWDKGFSIEPFLSVLHTIRPQNGTIYICTSHQLAPIIWAWMRQEQSTHSSYCVWCKPNPMPSLAKRHFTRATELICYATFGKHTFHFPEEGHALSWWNIQKNMCNSLHPTQKPLDIPLKAISHSSNKGDVIFDGFLGSGTTLIAGERLNRRVFGCEIDEKYATVVLNRWEAETKQEAVLLDRVSPVSTSG